MLLRGNRSSEIDHCGLAAADLHLTFLRHRLAVTVPCGRDLVRVHPAWHLVRELEDMRVRWAVGPSPIHPDGRVRAGLDHANRSGSTRFDAGSGLRLIVALGRLTLDDGVRVG